MQFSTLATIALVAGSAMASYPVNGTVSYTTEVVTAYTTYCPEATSVVVGSSTYTVTEATSLTISGTMTIVKPVTTSSIVYCNSCTGTGLPPTYPTSAPVYPNSTVTYAPTSVGTTYIPSSTPTTPVTANNGNKVVGMSGAALAGLLDVAAYVL